jgi:hypothetical protein
MRRLIGVAAMSFLLTGCGTILHELQPHRLWRMNYSDSPGRTDGAFFSVEDELPDDSAATTDASRVDDARRYSR